MYITLALVVFGSVSADGGGGLCAPWFGEKCVQGHGSNQRHRGFAHSVGEHGVDRGRWDWEVLGEPSCSRLWSQVTAKTEPERSVVSPHSRECSCSSQPRGAISFTRDIGQAKAWSLNHRAYKCSCHTGWDLSVSKNRDFRMSDSA